MPPSMLVRFSLALATWLLLAVPAGAQTSAPTADRDTVFEGKGNELVMVYLGASHCGPCLDPAFKASLEEAKVALAEHAASDGQRFVAVGAALDHDVEQGVAFLSGSGRFDEIIVGRNWLNSASLAHLWRPDRPEDQTVGLPAIVVFEQRAMLGDGVSSTAPRYLTTVTGRLDIPAWVEAGAPLE